MKHLITKDEYIAEVKNIFGADTVIDEAGLQEALVQKYQQGNSTWLIKLLSVFGGFMAFTTFSLFMFSSELLKMPILTISLGILSIAMAIFIAKKSLNLVMETFIICAFINGFFVLSTGMNKLVHYPNSDDASMLSTILVAMIALLVSNRSILVFFSVLIIEGAIVGLIMNHNAMNFMHAFIAVNVFLFVLMMTKEASLLSKKGFLSRKYIALRYAFMASLWLVNFVLLAIFETGVLHREITFRWIITILAIIPIMWLMYELGAKMNLANTWKRILLPLIVVIVISPTIHYPAIAISLLILLFSFRIDFLTGIIAGALGLVFFIGQFYYDLHDTLLVKSYMMLGTGVMLLLILFVTRKKLFTHEEK